MNIRIQAARENHLGISVVRRCELLKVNRSTVYYQSDQPDQDDIWLICFNDHRKEVEQQTQKVLKL